MITTSFDRNGISYYLWGGQVHNSSAYSLAEMDTAWNTLAALKSNTAGIWVTPDVGVVRVQMAE